MKISDTYDKFNNDHKLFLAQESKCLGKFTREELRELSNAMHHHKLKLAELLRAMRSYIANPFGKYFFMGK
jgi:hypothetical protein